MRWVCVVIMWSLQTRIEKSFSYSISYSYSNLKVPNLHSRETVLYNANFQLYLFAVQYFYIFFNLRGYLLTLALCSSRSIGHQQ